VDKLLDETTTASGTVTSFNTFEQTLEALLVDSVGRTPLVNLTTTSDENRSDLMVEIVLAWDWIEQFLINLDLETLMEDEDTTGDISHFAKNLIPREDADPASLEASVFFRLGVGLEYDKRGKKINPYIQGTTGFYVEFRGNASGNYTVQAGMFEASLDVEAVISGVQRSDPLSLSVGLNKSLNYYLGDPGVYSRDREGFKNVSISQLVNELKVDFDGSIKASVSVGLALIGTTANFGIEVTDLNRLFRGDKTALKIAWNVTKPKFQVPTLLDILLAEPQGLIDALDGIFKKVEDASLGRNGIVTNNPIPHLRNGLARSLGAGTDQNILAQGHFNIILAVLDNFDSLGEPDTIAHLLATKIGTALNSTGILRAGEEVDVFCYVYNTTTQNLTSALRHHV